MGAIASQITSLTIVYSTVYSDADQQKHQSSASLAFVRGVHRRPVNSPHKWPVTRKRFPFDDIIMDESRNSWVLNGPCIFLSCILMHLRKHTFTDTHACMLWVSNRFLKWKFVQLLSSSAKYRMLSNLCIKRRNFLQYILLTKLFSSGLKADFNHKSIKLFLENYKSGKLVMLHTFGDMNSMPWSQCFSRWDWLWANGYLHFSCSQVSL